MPFADNKSPAWLHDGQCRRIEAPSQANAEVQAINHPIGDACSRLGRLESCVEDILRILDAYTEVERDNPAYAWLFIGVKMLRETLDIDLLKEDVSALLDETRERAAEAASKRCHD